MAANVKAAILQAQIEGILYEIMLKTNAANVVLDDTGTTLAAKLSEMVASLNEKAKASDVTQEISTAIDGLINGAPGTYDTLKEISDYITAHDEVVDALNAAIGNKVDKVEGKGLSTNDFTDALKAKVDALGTLASKSSVSESDLDAALKEKINNVSTDKHTHDNKELLDTYTQTEEDLADAVAKKHDHTNKAVLDEISATDIAGWNGKSKVYIQASAPADMKDGDIFMQIVE